MNGVKLHLVVYYDYLKLELSKLLVEKVIIAKIYPNIFILLNALIKILRDLNLMVKYETFNLCYMGSIPIDLKLYKRASING